MSLHAAVDLGASSGRVVLATVGTDQLDLRELQRFPNAPVQRDDGLHWDLEALKREIRIGLDRLPAGTATVGIDTWAVDYGLLSSRGVSEPWCYRDPRTDGIALSVTREQLFAVNGLQHLPFTTVYQLMAQKVPRDSTMLLLPDLLAHWLTGHIGAEVTNASTTGLLDVRTRQWSCELAHALHLHEALLPPLVQPGDRLGQVPGTTAELVAVGSHDTASAVVGTPLRSPESVYISLGTWALVGVELDEPILTLTARDANFTNELGVDDTVRFLRNVMGLWLLQECLREWETNDIAGLLAAAADIPQQPVFDVDDPRFLAPGDMPLRICAALEDLGYRPPRRRATLVRCIIDSLVAALARTVHEVVILSGRQTDVVHVVGGGSQNSLLCTLLAQKSGLPVIAGPVEATALGNVLVQARAHGTLSGGLAELRQLVRRTQQLRRFEP